MQSLSGKKLTFFPLILAISLALSACGALFGTPATPTLQAPTSTPVPPSPTPPPLAAVVNDEWITEEEFQAELDRYLAAQRSLELEASEEQAATLVLADMIDMMLLAQAARAEGFVLSETDLQSRVDALASQVGGKDALVDWEISQGYTDESFRFSLKRMAEAAWMRDKIVAAVPVSMEQIHLREILLYNEETAQKVADQLDAGASFSDLAELYDPATAGELGWFPRGFLFEQVLEDEAFGLEPGTYSEVIRSEVGFHILQVVERDMDHELSPEAYLVLQEKTLNDWLQQQRSTAVIERNP
jgi:peptidyl-prolyl cis-trans isomerase C